MTETYWAGERKFLAVTVLDDTTPVTVYTVAFVPIGTDPDLASWVANTTYDGKRGVWVDNLDAGTYRVLAKAGTEPDEVDIVECGYVNIRTH